MKSLKVCLACAALLMSAAGSFGQEAQIVPPVPNAMKMTEYQTQRPNMYTGTANVSIPLYTIDFDGWKLPLSLSYNATGIRTNEEASEVGLGWSLNATGVISRTIRGGDDLSLGGPAGHGVGYVYSDSVVKIEMGYDPKVDTEVGVGSNFYAEGFLRTYFYWLAATLPDTEPDLFNYNFFGYSGSFLLTQKVADSSGEIKVVKVTEDASNIFFDESNLTFTIVTPNGYQGRFKIKEKSTSFSGSTTVAVGNREACCGQNLIDAAQMENESGRLRGITSWYLSEIVSPNLKHIFFNHHLQGVDTNGIDSLSHYISNSKAFAEFETISSNETCIQVIQEHVYLKSIISDDVKIQFSMTSREDLRVNTLFTSSQRRFVDSSPLQRYSGITITGRDAASTLNKSIVFTQGYFNQERQGASEADPAEYKAQWLRSRLDKVKVDDQEYRFSYLEGSKGVPNKLTTGIDHFGFYNGQDMNARVQPPNPTGYVSCDPFTVNDTTIYYQQLSSRRVDFAFGKAGLLSTVKYPTKGYTVFEYEPHTYIPDSVGLFLEVQGAKIAGGARIKSITDYDYATDRVQRKKTYKYQNNHAVAFSPSTGRLMTPLYNRYVRTYAEAPHYCMYLYKTNSSIPGNSSAEGKIIGYSKVHEVTEGEGASFKTTVRFENEPNKILPFNSVAVGQPNLNGQMKSERQYDSSGKVVQETLNQNYIHSLDSVLAITYRRAPSDPEALGPDHQLDFWAAHYTTRSFHTPFTIVTKTAEIPSVAVEDTNGDITWGNALTTTKNLSYNNKFLVKTQETTGSANEVMKIETRRAIDYSSPSTTISRMRDPFVNLAESVVEEITYRNDTVIAATGNFYNYDAAHSKVNLKAVYAYNPALGSFPTSHPSGSSFASPFEVKVNYTLHDSTTGKPTQFTGRDGVVNSFIWGYNGTLPIVHGKGLTYSQLNQAYAAVVGHTNYESDLRAYSSVAGGFVTTFNHNPLVGLSGTVDPSGLKKSYAYDAFGRLKRISDNDGNTLTEYDYHFKQTPPTRILTISGDINFGTICPDFYDSKPSWYVSCVKDLTSKVITFSNDGDSELMVHYFTPPAGFDFEWHGGPIAPGTSLPVKVTFTGSTSGLYEGSIDISSDKTNSGMVDVNLSATRANRICNVSVQNSVLDFGEVTGFTGIPKSFNVVNNGNAPVKLSDALFQWDGHTVDNGAEDFIDSDFKVGRTPYCLQPGESKAIYVYYAPQVYGSRTAKISLLVDECPNLTDVVTVKGKKVNALSYISMDTTPINIDFPETSLEKTFTITNTGNMSFNYTGVSYSNSSAASYFSASPTSFSVAPGESKNVTVTFTPSGFGSTTTNITFLNNAISGDETVSFTGNMYVQKKIELSSHLLTFPISFTDQTVTITNTGNTDLVITGVSPTTTSEWSINITTGTLAPNSGSTTLTVRRIVSNASPLTITVLSNKNAGDETLVVKQN